MKTKPLNETIYVTSSHFYRDIYLPVGKWRDEVDPNHQVYTGPIWIRAYYP